MPTLSKNNTQNADLIWQDDVPVNVMFNDPYFSLVSGEAESQYVFLQHNNLPKAFSQNTVFSIAETGFGTGLNFFVTASHWMEALVKNNEVTSLNEKETIPHLYYFSIEKYPISRQDLVNIYQQWPQFDVLSEQLVEQYSGSLAGFHQINFPEQNISLILMVGDVEEMLNEIHTDTFNKIDAWYLDGFSPSKNPDMWTEKVFEKIHKLSHAKTTFATFTAAGFVRRAMKASGFDVKKAPGFGKKREMLYGYVIDEKSECEDNNSSKQTGNSANSPPWYSLKNIQKQPCQKLKEPVIIIGSGIAGLSCAVALAEKNIHSILLEKSDTLGAGASGNKTGIVMPRISAKLDNESSYYINSFQYAVNYYGELKKKYSELEWIQNGVLQFESQKKLAKIDRLSLPLNLVKVVNSEEASHLAKIKITDSALYLSHAGTINPAQLCNILAKVAGDKLQVHFQSKVTSLEKEGDYWLVKDDKNKKVFLAKNVIIASGYDAKKLLKTDTLTVKPSRGQLSYVPSTVQSSKLSINLCGDGYVVPSNSDTLAPSMHVIGASYGGDSVELSNEDHMDNMSKAGLLLGDELIEDLKVSDKSLSGRVSFRTTTKDHLPVVGPVINEAFHRSQYHDLSHGKKFDHYKKAEYAEGLFLSVGHGSRGLVTCISSAKYIASLVLGHPITEPASIVKLLHSGRFLVRELKRKKLSE